MTIGGSFLSCLVLLTNVSDLFGWSVSFPTRVGSSVSRWLRPTLTSSRNDHLETIKRSMTSLQLQSSQRFLLDHRDKSQTICRLHSVSGESSTDQQKFATMCGAPNRVQEVVDLTITKDIRPLLAEDKLTYITLNVTNEHVSGQSDGYGYYPSVDHEDLIEACILPPSSHCAFPSSLDYGKQYDILAPNVMLRRRMPLDEWRFNHSIECLRLRDKAMKVAWIGHPGIGKSTEANFLMMELLSHLGEEGWPNTILHRVKYFVHEYKRMAMNQPIEYSKKEVIGLTDLDMMCNTYYDKCRRTSERYPLVIVELEEEEVNPKTSGLPTFIALSAGDVDNTLKTFEKGNTGRFLTVRPHTHKEMRTLCRLFYQFDRSKLLKRFDLPTTANEEDALKVLDDRIAKVGCMLRIVLKATMEFNNYISKI